MSGVPWGGSEELWWRSARLLQTQGHQVTVNYKWWEKQADQISEVEEHGATLFLRDKPPENFWYSGLLNLFRTVKSKDGTDESWLE